MRFWQVFVASGLILSSGLGLLIMSGNARGLMAPSLRAELVVQDFPLPPEMGIDPSRVADFLASELQDRLGDDVAIRLTLQGDTIERVRDLVLPRLMNVVAVQRMMDGLPEMRALLELGSFRQTVSGIVYSRDQASDVALTVPGAVLASVDGTIVDVATTSTGLTAIELGEIAAGQSVDIVLWLNHDGTTTDLGKSIRLGADDGQRGRVLLSGDRGWFGADVEALRWARWLIGSLLSVVLVFGLASLVLPILGQRQAKRRQPSVQVTGRP